MAAGLKFLTGVCTLLALSACFPLTEHPAPAAPAVEATAPTSPAKESTQTEDPAAQPATTVLRGALANLVNGPRAVKPIAIHHSQRLVLNPESDYQRRAEALVQQNQRTVLNFGCDLSGKDMTGMTLKYASDFQSGYYADTIFICGQPPELAKPRSVLFADRVILVNTKIVTGTTKTEPIRLVIHTKTLVLEGENQIRTGPHGTTLIDATALSGDGTLEVL